MRCQCLPRPAKRLHALQRFARSPTGCPKARCLFSIDCCFYVLIGRESCIMSDSEDERMPFDGSELLAGNLWFGGEGCASDKEQRDKLGITHVVTYVIWPHSHHNHEAPVQITCATVRKRLARIATPAKQCGAQVLHSVGGVCVARRTGG